MRTGRIERYFESKGFGFIAADDGEERGETQWFFHITKFVPEEIDPTPGMRVSFEVGVNPRDGRECAENVRPI